MAEDQPNSIEFKVDTGDLYREESFTDLKAGTIKRLVPVRPDGSKDNTRKTVFVGHTSILTPDGPLPIQNVIAAKELQQAIKKFPEAMHAAMDRLMEEVKRYQKEHDFGEEVVLRIGIAAGGCSGFSYTLNFDDNFDDKVDSKYDCHGVAVVVDKKSALYLDGTTVDWQDNERGQGFSFDNPNVVRACACGHAPPA